MNQLIRLTDKDPKIIHDMMSMFPCVKYSSIMNDLDDKWAYKPTKKCIYIAHSLPTIAHEIAHMVEMNDFSRLLLQDWGLKLGPNVGFTSAAREIRVRAIQGLMEPERNRLVNNYFGWMIPLFGKLPFGRFKTKQDVIDWENDLHHRILRAWSLDRIFHEWKLRVDYIRNWQETNEPLRHSG